MCGSAECAWHCDTVTRLCNCTVSAMFENITNQEVGSRGEGSAGAKVKIIDDNKVKDFPIMALISTAQPRLEMSM